MRKILWFAANLRFAPWFALGAICLMALGFMAYASYHEAAVMDELAHIPAGYGYVRHLDYRLNPEHPPLLKALAALPLLLLHPRFPTDTPAWQTAINGQWDMGSLFLYGAGNDADELVRAARIMPMLLTLAFIILVYAAGRSVLGKYWALLPAFLTAVSPTILAHGHYVTTDVAASFGILLGIHFFLRALETKKGRDIFFAGVAFGIAELLKFSAVLLMPLFGVLMLVRMWTAKEFWKPLRTTLLTGLIGYILVVYPVYALFTANYPAAKQVDDTRFILTSFAGGARPEGCGGVRCLADLTIWAAGHNVTRPFAEYSLGVLMVMQRAAGGNTAYFMGEVSAAGSRLYFPVVYLVKESLPALVIVLFAAIWGLFDWLRKIMRTGVSETRLRIRERFTEFSWLAFIVLYWGWSMKSPLNIGFRHILPTIPFMYLLAASWWRRRIVSLPEGQGQLLRKIGILFRAFFRNSLKFGALAVLVFWALLETAFAAPYFLSYFNELGGGTKYGYEFVTDSNYDWGQDLLRLKAWSDAHPDEKIAVDYFGGGSPAYYLGDRAVAWWSAKGSPASQGIHWFAVSVNSLQGAIQKQAPGFERKPEDSYLWLTSGRTYGNWDVPRPDERIGTSIFLYHL